MLKINGIEIKNVDDLQQLSILKEYMNGTSDLPDIKQYKDKYNYDVYLIAISRT